MRIICLVLWCVTVGAQRNDCEDFCNCDTGTLVTCSFLPRFPQFLSTRLIVTLVLRDCTLTRLQFNEGEYGRLTTLILRNSNFTSCSDIQHVRATRPTLNIIFDGAESCIGEAGDVSITTDSQYTTTVTSLNEHVDFAATTTAITTTPHQIHDSTNDDPTHITMPITTRTTSGGQTASASAQRSDTSGNNKDITTILSTSITSVVIIGGVVLAIVVVCAYKKCMANRVRAINTRQTHIDPEDPFVRLANRERVYNPTCIYPLDETQA